MIHDLLIAIIARSFLRLTCREPGHHYALMVLPPGSRTSYNAHASVWIQPSSWSSHRSCPVVWRHLGYHLPPTKVSRWASKRAKPTRTLPIIGNPTPLVPRSRNNNSCSSWTILTENYPIFLPNFRTEPCLERSRHYVPCSRKSLFDDAHVFKRNPAYDPRKEIVPSQMTSSRVSSSLHQGLQVAIEACLSHKVAVCRPLVIHLRRYLDQERWVFLPGHSSLITEWSGRSTQFFDQSFPHKLPDDRCCQYC